MLDPQRGSGLKDPGRVASFGEKSVVLEASSGVTARPISIACDYAAACLGVVA